MHVQQLWKRLIVTAHSSAHYGSGPLDLDTCNMHFLFCICPFFLTFNKVPSFQLKGNSSVFNLKITPIINTYVPGVVLSTLQVLFTDEKNEVWKLTNSCKISQLASGGANIRPWHPGSRFQAPNHNVIMKKTFQHHSTQNRKMDSPD